MLRALALAVLPALAVAACTGSGAGSSSSDGKATGSGTAKLVGSGPAIVTPAALIAEQPRIPFLTSLMPVEAFASGDKAGWTYSWDLFYDEKQQAAVTPRYVTQWQNGNLVQVQPRGPADRRFGAACD
jgi:hypothetical protein